MTAIFEKLANVKDNELTGRYYHKMSFFGLVLMVEEKYTMHTGDADLPMTYWRRGSVEDLKQLDLISK